MRKLFDKIIFVVLASFLFTSCLKKEEVITPKPVGYFRIAIPEPDRVSFDTILPFTFDYEKAAVISIVEKEKGTFWFDLAYPEFSATVKMTYHPLKDNLRELVLDEDKMVMFHVEQRMAEDVVPSIVSDPKSRLYGQIYELKGKNVASTMQFWLTDSVDHYVRGTLYFDFIQNNDSLAPVIDYLHGEMMTMIETWQWERSPSDTMLLGSH